jgi:hypothetical protein
MRVGASTIYGLCTGLAGFKFGVSFIDMTAAGYPQEQRLIGSCDSGGWPRECLRCFILGRAVDRSNQQSRKRRSFLKAAIGTPEQENGSYVTYFVL